MSAASSGGVFSSATLTASVIAATGSARLSAIWRCETTISRGTPCIRSRPLTSRHGPSEPSSGANAAPMSILIRSAELSPISRLWLRRM